MMSDVNSWSRQGGSPAEPNPPENTQTEIPTFAPLAPSNPVSQPAQPPIWPQPAVAQPQVWQPQTGQPQVWQPPTGQPQYEAGYAPPPYQPGMYVPPLPGSQHPFAGRATTVLVLGLVSVFGVIFCVGPLLGPVALIMGLRVRRDSLAAGYPEPGSNTAGWILGLLGTLLLLLFFGLLGLNANGAFGETSQTY